jgi:hypothetical protein
MLLLSHPILQTLFSITSLNNLIERKDFNTKKAFEEHDSKDYDLKEALNAVDPESVSTTEQASSSAFLPYQKFNQTYLSRHLYRLYNHHSTIPLQFLTQPSPNIQNCTFAHPIWSRRKWSKIWKSKPIMLNPITVPLPTIETVFHGTLLRIHLTTAHLTTLTLPFAQGTLITFKGDDTSHTRYVVEWCEQKDEHYAYLKVIGMGQYGNPCPYNDPFFPAFLLIIPLHFSNVRTRPYSS